MKHVIPVEKKREVVEEYLKGKDTLRSLGAKHGFDFRLIGAWVKDYRKKAETSFTIDSQTEKKTSSYSEFVATIAETCQKYGLNADIVIRDGKLHKTEISGK